MTLILQKRWEKFKQKTQSWTNNLSSFHLLSELIKERTPLNMTGGQPESFYFGYAPKANIHSMIKAL